MDEKNEQISAMRVREALKAAGIKQKDLADALDYSPDYIYAIVGGRRKLTNEIARSISKLTGFRTEYLLGEDEYKTLRDLALRSREWTSVMDDGIDTILEFISESRLNTSMRIEVDESFSPSDLPMRKTYYFKNRDDLMTIPINGREIAYLKKCLELYVQFLLERLLEEGKFMEALRAFTESGNEKMTGKESKKNESP